MKQVWIILLISVALVNARGQAYSTTSKKAIKRFEVARSCFERMDDACVEEALMKA